MFFNAGPGCPPPQMPRRQQKISRERPILRFDWEIFWLVILALFIVAAVLWFFSRLVTEAR